MHELSIASSIVENLMEFTAEQNGGQVVSVRLLVGELTHVEFEQLSFCYQAITKETPLEGSTLEFEKLNASVRCPSCEYSGPPKYWEDALASAPVATLQCPGCGSAVEVVEGEECAIKTVRLLR